MTVNLDMMIINKYIKSARLAFTCVLQKDHSSTETLQNFSGESSISTATHSLVYSIEMSSCFGCLPGNSL